VACCSLAKSQLNFAGFILLAAKKELSHKYERGVKVNGTLGWVNVALIASMGLILPLRAQYLKTKDKKSLELLQRVRTFHPKVGVAIIMLGLVHGYMSLGEIRFHTGTLIIMVLTVMALLALGGPRWQPLKKSWRAIHRNMGLALWFFIFLHIFYRSLF